MSRITTGIRDAAEDVLGEFDGAVAFQEAILTSDTCTKSCSVQINTGIGEITIGGVVKRCRHDRTEYGYHAGFHNY